MKNSFWNYYKGEEFNKKKWLIDYIKSRKEKRTELSPTRSKIEKLVQGKFKKYQCLETNVYSKPSNVLKNLSEKDKNTDIFNFLIRSIKPKAILIHGKIPIEFMKNELNVRFGLGEPVMSEYEMKNTINPFVSEWEFGKIAICASRHFRLIAMTEIENAADGLLKIMKK